MIVTAELALQTVEGTGLAFEARVAGHSLTFDSGATAEAPTPMQVVLAAVGGCTAMDVISILRKKRQQVTGYELVVTGEKAEEHPKVFTRIEVLHRVRGHDISPAAVEDAIRRSDSKYCSLHAMREASVKRSSRFEILPA